MASKIRFSDGSGVYVTFDGTSDGTTTNKVVKYDPLPPELRTLSVSRVTEDGEETIAQAYKDVTEEIELYIAGTSTQIKTTFRRLNRMWEQARRYQETPVWGRATYIEIMPEGDSVWWQCELINASSDLEVGALDMFIGQGKVIFTVTIRRKFFWEQGSETEIWLANPIHEKASGGIQIENCRDNGGAGPDRYNYVEIDTADIIGYGGDLPTPIRFKITNDWNNLTYPDWTIYAGMAYIPYGVTHVHQIEGEDTSYGTLGGPDYSTYSAGYYRTLSWTGTAEQVIGLWNLDSTMLSASNSNYFMVYLVTRGTAKTDLYLRFKITAVGMTTVLWTGPQVLVPAGRDIVVMGPIQLPPVRQISGTPYPEELVLTAQAASGSGTIIADVISLMPMESWRQYIPNQYGLAYLAHLMDDAPNRQLYTDGWTTAGHLYNYTGYGPWFIVTPTNLAGTRYRFVFLWNVGATYGYQPNRTLTIRAYARVRRRQI